MEENEVMTEKDGAILAKLIEIIFTSRSIEEVQNRTSELLNKRLDASGIKSESNK